MFDNIDPATKQYIIFSAVVSLLISIFINFIFVNLMTGTFAYGFPINLGASEGIVNILLRTINTVIIGLFLTVPIYYLIIWWIKRER